MTSISLRLSSDLLYEADAHANAMHLSRTSYIRKAIRAMNLKTHETERKQHLMNVSKKVRAHSMDINAEFSAIEDDPEA